MNKFGMVLVGGLVLVVVIFGFSFVFRGDSQQPEPVMTNESNDTQDAMTQDIPTQEEVATTPESMELDQPGESSAQYVAYSEEALAKATADGGRAVLFFAALDWCPSCKAADKDLQANLDQIPSDVTVLRVDYDRDTANKEKYNIIVQDTFVQVDENGTEVTQWNSGGQGVSALLASIE